MKEKWLGERDCGKKKQKKAKELKNWEKDGLDVAWLREAVLFFNMLGQRFRVPNCLLTLLMA